MKTKKINKDNFIEICRNCGDPVAVSKHTGMWRHTENSHRSYACDWDRNGATCFAEPAEGALLVTGESDELGED